MFRELFFNLLRKGLLQPNQVKNVSYLHEPIELIFGMISPNLPNLLPLSNARTTVEECFQALQDPCFQ